MRVLSISTDRNIFKEDSEVRRRMVDYGGLVNELHIIIFCNKEGEKDQKIADNVWVYPTNSKSRWFYIWNAIRIGKEIDAKFNLVTSQDPFETGLVGWQLAKKLKLPLQIQIHTDLFSPYFKKDSFLNRVRVKIAKIVLPKAKCIRVVSERIKKSLKFNSFILPIYVDFKKIKDAEINVDLHKKYPGKKIILVVSRLAREKNVSLALRAMERVIKKHPEAIMVIVGEGPERRKFKPQANVFFEGLVPYNALMSYYKTADVLLLTSNYDGYGMVLAEAAAVGLPIVSTDVGIAREVAGAKVVPVADRGAVVNALVEQIKNPQKTEIADTYTYQKYLEKIKEGWEACI